ncbi:MAG: hypothetical protein CMH54_01145 [Myxococcales bacterium]|nr:hypothetical protein [Myxococcales bacterium]
MNKELARFRWIALIEGISYLVLLGIAMPLKYLAGIALAVKIVGWIHGILFMLYLAFGFQAARIMKWSLRFQFWAFVASLVPFGTFVLDKHLRAEVSTTSE